MKLEDGPQFSTEGLLTVKRRLIEARTLVAVKIVDGSLIIHQSKKEMFIAFLQNSVFISMVRLRD